MGECLLEPIPAATECHVMPSNAIPSNVSSMDWLSIALEWHAFLPNGMPLNGAAMGECLAPILTATECHAMTLNAIPPNVGGRQWMNA